ncbi:4-hydroxy-tetrahydrodipicolinate synthase [Crocinitomicaceae bacterium]|jgi:4-hydroxy-tetrahydrodipicolinate synthase|nr:4-hydroxy-tetrahydrodipicolinate synthase [Crocinitomicaceae bacterium]MDG1346319.1 4-hydroxy-tetrahydrodipicolinate synthase [Crocinitomicaceae bacterium]
MTNPFKGTGTALVTPFKSDGAIDLDALKKFIEFQIQENVDFLVVQGTTGESPTLSWEEKLEILDIVAEVNAKRKPIVFGLGGNNTAEIAKKMGQLPSSVDGILSVSPYYNKPIQKGIVEHFKYVASHTDLPIILYNVPGRTASNMSIETTLELAEVPNIVAVKEASGNIEQIMDIIRQRPDGFGVLSGDDPLVLPLVAAGADGVISVVSNSFPKDFSNMVRWTATGKHAEAKAIHYNLFEITKLFFAQGNPGGVKEALKQMNLMENHMRMPLVNVSVDLAKAIYTETARIIKH